VSVTWRVVRLSSGTPSWRSSSAIARGKTTVRI
jgi:hypothetical protein